MTKRFLMLLSVIFVSVVANAAHTVRIEFYQPTVVNGTIFKRGEAKLEIKSDKAIIRQGKSSVETSVKIENSKIKCALTAVGYKDSNDHNLKDICVGGTTTHLLF